MKWPTLVGAVLAAAMAGAPVLAKPYPLEQWAMRHVVDNVRISPDGSRLALLKIPTRDGDPVIEIYDATDLEKEPFRLDADPMELRGFLWINNDRILFGARQAIRKKIDGFNRGIYGSAGGMLDLEREKVTRFSDEVVLASLLPHKPDKVLLAVPPPGGNKDGPFAEYVRRILPYDYYEYDLKKGSRKLMMQGKLSLGDYRFDGEGNLWMARGFDVGAEELIWYWRTPEEKWQEFYRMPRTEAEFRPFRVMGIDETKPHHAYVITRNGHDKAGLWSYDMKNGRFAEEIYRRSDVDVAGVRYHRNQWANPGKIVGVTYLSDRTHTEYFDTEAGAIRQQLEGHIPHAHNLEVSSSRDGRTLVVSNHGPKDPSTYYLLREGKLETVGSHQPLFDSENLGDVEYHTYAARDGLRLAVYVTHPVGPAAKPPHPLVVLPHGGPFARDGTGYEKWAQLLANHGYLVAQPQFRSSQGYGEAVYRAAYAERGQWGRAMQDDKDDVARYLVKKGLADPDRMAMFGWSYGGYAAAVAASRTPQLYQCVIAGAAVFDPMMQVNYYSSSLPKALRRRWVPMHEVAVDPMEEVAKVNVPMLIVHGDVDQRVPVEHARKYRKALDEHKKPYKYVELKQADHFYSTLFHNHQLEFFSAMLDFLQNDCGPGGL